jgi:hypothetical protein
MQTKAEKFHKFLLKLLMQSSDPEDLVILSILEEDKAINLMIDNPGSDPTILRINIEEI